jgi:hypothetical protein
MEARVLKKKSVPLRERAMTIKGFSLFMLVTLLWVSPACVTLGRTRDKNQLETQRAVEWEQLNQQVGMPLSYARVAPTQEARVALAGDTSTVLIPVEDSPRD